MTSKKKLRGMSISLPPWWLDDLNLLASKKNGWTQERLAVALTNVYGRDTDWDHKTVGNFLKGKHATIEMMRAFCALFDMLPPCQFSARNPREAMQMLSISTGFDTDAERATRRAMLDRAMLEHRRLADDHTATLDSRDEARARGSRRTGSLDIGRRTPPRPRA